MKDFLLIKRLQHCYYDLTRVKRNDLAAFLLSSGPFIDPNTLKEKVPSVVKELASTKKRLSMVMPVPAERALAGGLAAAEESSEAELEALRQQLSEKDQQLSEKDAEIEALRRRLQEKDERSAAHAAASGTVPSSQLSPPLAPLEFTKLDGTRMVWDAREMSWKLPTSEGDGAE